MEITRQEKVMVEIIWLTQSVLFRIHSRNTTVAFKRMLKKIISNRKRHGVDIECNTEDFIVI